MCFSFFKRVINQGNTLFPFSRSSVPCPKVRWVREFSESPFEGIFKSGFPSVVPEKGRKTTQKGQPPTRRRSLTPGQGTLVLHIQHLRDFFLGQRDHMAAVSKPGLRGLVGANKKLRTLKIRWTSRFHQPLVVHHKTTSTIYIYIYMYIYIYIYVYSMCIYIYIYVLRPPPNTNVFALFEVWGT